ncbi:hypothetical protein [Mycobacteroides abscessus]|uniref:hypothetical protein n=1 Tax=Mycobacteroides abscessus TaxID=36809 RepID=UPI00092809A2|nr:hypothetical protein [Mycobacteroides abscessus]MBL3752299.1 hypothetical protein [Mycobacteroides abscessus subsp. massiliense]QSN49739.1 hypothetical protein I3U33_26785 [Mycobacteroides abscessus subsp. abscessus]SII84390.1 NLP/P60 protein [Mycobacteroides abscessus subsp. abscessus]SIK56603.1 NLP/P60 protein [Mycobacteroides abscessus subsp. abscessus]SIL84700.1 NLP/P60 protein [Mycobacteroides abscessus subsp. abscessus]
MLTDTVDDVLRHARTLLGGGQPPAAPVPRPVGCLTARPGRWEGCASTAAGAVLARLEAHQSQLESARTCASAAVSAGQAIVHTARTGLAAIETDWHTDKQSINPFAGTTEGQAALLQAGTRTVSETRALVVDTASQFRAAATEVGAAARGLPTVNERIAPLDNDGTNGTLGPNGVGRIDDIQSGISGPYDLDQTPDRSVIAQMPPGVGADGPIHQGPAVTVAQLPPGVGPDAPLLAPPPPGPPAGH